MTISTSSWYVSMIGFMEKNKDDDDDDDDDDNNDDTWTPVPHCTNVWAFTYAGSILTSIFAPKIYEVPNNICFFI